MNIDTNQSLKFDEQFSQTALIATLNLDIESLVANNPLLDFQYSYDDIDYLKYLILDISSESTIALVCREHSPITDIDIYIDPARQDYSSLLVETLRYLRLTIQNLKWVHPSLNLPPKIFYINEELLGGRYIIREQLGALTYKAKNTTLNTSFILRFKGTNESNESFDSLAQMLMDFRRDNNVTHTIMKWTYDDKSNESISFTVQEYLETAKSFDSYLVQENSIQLKRIKLIEVAIILSSIYEKICDSNFIICTSNILIHNGHVKIARFKQLGSEKSRSIYYLLNLVSNILDSLKINTYSLIPRDFEVTNDDLQEQNFIPEFEKCIQGFHHKIKNTEFTNTIFQDLRNALQKVKIKEEEVINNFSPLVKGTVQFFELFIDNLVNDKDLNEIWPPTENRIFYATLLFKSVIHEDQFVRVYFGRYEKDIQHSSSNWEKDNELFAKEKLLISNSCAGFPIVYYNEQDRKELNRDKGIRFKLYHHNDFEFIKYVIVKDVKKAKTEPGIIRSRYQKAGWNLTTKDGLSDGEVSDNVDSMITIPIYKPNSTIIDKDAILAVVHIEIIQVLDPNDLDKISEQLALLIQSKFTDVIISLFHRTSESSKYVKYI
jgi:hypothetical protein